MSYRISYTSKGVQKKIFKDISIPPAVSISVLVSLILLIGFLHISNNAEHAVHMLIPWTKPYIETAISELESNIHNGVSVTDALAAFCKEIIAYVSI